MRVGLGEVRISHTLRALFFMLIILLWHDQTGEAEDFGLGKRGVSHGTNQRLQTAAGSAELSVNELELKSMTLVISTPVFILSNDGSAVEAVLDAKSLK